MINQFTDGMNTFGKLWAAFKAIFSFNYSSRGSNRREAEEDTIYCWEMVLIMIEGTFYSFKEHYSFVENYN